MVWNVAEMPVLITGTSFMTREIRFPVRSFVKYAERQLMDVPVERVAQIPDQSLLHGYHQIRLEIPEEVLDQK